MNAVEIAPVIVAATNALTLLDADSLDGIADRLQAFLWNGGSISTTSELEARYRIFAGVLEATRQNLTVVSRVSRATESVVAQWGR
jgi:hypothetical protein